jgi:uncharacterized phage protein (TIGR01671 family)
MREIKFRAWDRISNQTYDVVYIDFEDQEVGIINFEDRTRKFDDVQLLQYTGLHDKNDTEVYEGDLTRSLPDGNEPREIFQVVWMEARFELHGVVTDKNWGMRIRPLHDVGDYVVIGNIYENPELLTV